MDLTQLHRLRETAIDKNWKELENFFNSSIQLRHNGIHIDLSDLERPSAIVETVESYHRGGIGTDAVNGAVIAMLADLALGLLGLAYFSEGMTATSSLTINYVKPLRASKIIARAEQTEVVNNRIFGIVRVMTENEEVCAYATGAVAKGISIRT